MADEAAAAARRARSLVLAYFPPLHKHTHTHTQSEWAASVLTRGAFSVVRCVDSDAVVTKEY